MKQGRFEEATKSLAYMRREEVNDPEILKEIAEIKAAIDEEVNATEGVTWKECLAPGIRIRFITGFCM